MEKHTGEKSTTKKSSLVDDFTDLVESSQQLVKSAVMEHKKHEQIKNIPIPTLWTHEELYEKKVIFAGMRQRNLLNAFREVRIGLLQKSKTDNMVVLVSSVAGSGSSSAFSLNLAATFALDQYKTALYVDCNPYQYESNKYIAGEVSNGLTQYLSDYGVTLEDIIYPSGIERLRIIPSGQGSESAAEIFNSKKMHAFVSEIKARYPDRFIVLDAPAIQQSTEARILSKYCDYTLLVVPFGKAVTDEVLAAVDVIGKEKFAGLVFAS
jgi:protein-tyrosine kinase